MLRSIKKEYLLIAILMFIVSGLFLQSPAIAKKPIVYEIPVKGTIDLGLAKFISRGIQQAEREEVEAIILTIDTFGGLVKGATDIRDSILNTKLPVIAYVENRAWSAGALITIASDKVYMNSGSSIGAAEPRPKDAKIVSAFRKEFQTTAEKTGRDDKLAAAMVDAKLKIEGLVDEGEILTLTAKEAARLEFINKVVNSKEEALAEGGYPDTKIIQLHPNLQEKLARFTSNPAVSTILITVGFLSLIIEGITLGWGAAGSIGLLSLGLYFTGRLIAGATGFGLILLFIVGVLLLALEVLVVPGFGITGLGGIIAVLGSLFFTFENKEVAIYVITISSIASILGIIIALKYFISSTAWSRIELSERQSKEGGYISNQSDETLIGKAGQTITPLRPAGIAEIDKKRLDVVTEGGFIAANEEVEVVDVQGRRIVVRKL